MTVSELIKALTPAQEQFGDIPVTAFEQDHYHYLPVCGYSVMGEKLCLETDEP